MTRNAKKQINLLAMKKMEKMLILKRKSKN